MKTYLAQLTVIQGELSTSVSDSSDSLRDAEGFARKVLGEGVKPV